MSSISSTLVAIQVLQIIHVLFFAFVLVAPWLLRCNGLFWYIVLMIFVLMDWNDFDGMCILTKIETWLQTGSWEAKSPVEGGPEFFRPLLNKLTNIQLTRSQADRLNNFLFLSMMLVAIVKLKPCITRW